MFGGAFSFSTVFILCATFLFSSVHLAFADTETLPDYEPVTHSVVTPDALSPPSMDEVPPPAATPADTLTPTPPPEPVETEPDGVLSDDTEDERASTTTPLLESEPPEAGPPDATNPDPASTSDPEEPVRLSDETEALPEVDEVGSVTEDHVDEAPEETEETMEVGSESEVVPVHTVMNADNYYQFGRDECVQVEGGSFYCGGRAGAAETPIEDGLFAAPDADGDLEIFLRLDGVETQITHNTVDDAAPYYDARSHSIVWHRLIDGRYQIISYDIATAAETQLTTGTTNNMEPSRYKNLTAWQSWIDNSWNIMLHDGKRAVAITDSPAHDVAPLVYEEYVLWNTTDSAGEQHIAMYDLTTAEITLIRDADGAAVRNPRMVLVYETANEHGDVLTKGFDLQSRTVVPLAAVPRPLPTHIPDSEQTGETRALIQNKSTGRDSEVVETTPTPTRGNAPPPEPTVASSTPEVVETPELEPTPVVVPETPEILEDLVVAPYEAEIESTPPESTDHIADVVLPPFSSEEPN